MVTAWNWRCAKANSTARKGRLSFLRRNLLRARKLTDKPILLREPLDGGNDAIDNIDGVLEHSEQHPDDAPVHYLIKRNPRRV